MCHYKIKKKLKFRKKEVKKLEFLLLQFYKLMLIETQDTSEILLPDKSSGVLSIMIQFISCVLFCTFVTGIFVSLSEMKYGSLMEKLICVFKL